MSKATLPCQNSRVTLMNNIGSKIFVFGAGGHAKVVIDAIEKQNQATLVFLGDDSKQLWGRDFFNYPVIGGREEVLNRVKALEVSAGAIAIGNNQIRKDIASWLKHNKVKLITVIHPFAQISRGASLGAGTVVFAGAIVNADSVIGENAIINTGATIDHDCVIGDFVHVSPGTNLCGGVQVGDGSFIGAGSVVIPGVKIGKNVVIGAGSTVINDIEDDMRVVGSPARKTNEK